MLRRSGGPQVELEQALKLSGSGCIEMLVKLSEKYPKHAPIWMELAEQSLKARRKEEVLHAAQRALQLDRHLYHHFSPQLKRVCEPLVEDERAARADHGYGVQLRQMPQRAHQPAFVAQDSRRQQQGGPLAVEIAKVRAGKGPQVRQRLEELTRKHPDKGIAWLALAEENIRSKRVEEALGAVERALVLDPALERNLSRDLMNARRYHQAESEHNAHKKYGNARRPEPPPVASPPSRPPAGQNFAPSQEVTIPDVPAGQGPSVGEHLALVLEVEDRDKRLKALESLAEVAPDNSAVLYHYALELAKAAEVDKARIIGKRLQGLSAERYAQLYNVAEKHFANARESADGPAAMPDDPDDAAETNFYAPLPKRQETPAPVAPAPVAPAPVMPAPVAPAPKPVAPVPVVPAPLPPSAPSAAPAAPPTARVAPAPMPMPPMQRPHPPAPQPRRWGTAGIAVAAVLAGLVFAVLVAFFLSRFDSVKEADVLPAQESPESSEDKKPSKDKKTDKEEPEMEPWEP